MQWADGDLLHSHIEKHLRYPASLEALRAKWVTLVRHLEAAQVAHGDLQHGNILVRGGSIQLVDYRSEEHTSELQSHSDLVCRLLLEKKKTHNHISPGH